MTSNLATLRSLLRPHRRAIVWVACASVVKAFAANARAYLMKPLTGAMLSHMPAATGAGAAAAVAPAAPATPGEFLVLAGLLLVLSLVLAGSSFVGESLQKRTMVRALIDLRLRIATHLLSVPIARYARERVGDLLARLTTDIRASETAVRTLGFRLWEMGFMVIGAIVTGCMLSPELTALMLLPFIPVAVAMLVLMGRTVREQSGRNLAAQADLTQSMQQILSGMKVIKVFHTEAREKERYAERSETQFRRACRVARARARSRSGAELLMNLGVAGAVAVGAVAVIDQWFGIRFDQFAGFAAVLMVVYAPIRGFNQIWNGFQESLPAIARTTAMLAWSPEPADQADARECPRLTQGIMFDRVTFTYDGGDEPALADVTLAVPAGKVTAIVGESGAGKSTFLDLLLRLADPGSGTVRWDGLDVRGVQRASLRARIALVSQDPFLFHATVAENLRYGRPGAPHEDLVAAARAADALEVIEGLPQQFQTVVGERGMRLSGGERQRLTIARALLRDPDLLLLDEATAALDSASESRVLAALDRLMHGRTTIWVAHRLTSVVQADQIVVLEAGAIAERGTHAELLAQGGAYARLWAQQGMPGTEEAA